MKEAVIELQGPLISSNSKHTNRRGESKSLGAAAVQKQRPASSSVLSLLSTIWVHTVRAWGGDDSEGSVAVRRKQAENEAASQREPKAVTQNLRARPRYHCKPQKGPSALAPAAI